MSDEKQNIPEVQNRYFVPPNYHPKTRKTTMFFLAEISLSLYSATKYRLSPEANKKKDTLKYAKRTQFAVTS